MYVCQPRVDQMAVSLNQANRWLLKLDVNEPTVGWRGRFVPAVNGEAGAS